MNKYHFDLQPFEPGLIDIKISGKISRNTNNLSLGYKLEGELEKIEIPAIENIPNRKNELWEATCFEFFLGIKNSSRYWEFNLSPSGHWNIYRFDDYRQGMEEEIAVTSLPFSVQHDSDNLLLNLEMDLGKLISEKQSLEVGITTVIQDKNRNITYWALTHCGKEADFHLRDSFVVEL
ncbi:MAG: DOMON-like domain-containing protein [Nostocaceae cyanobacterium]|nr:DOMON-like domain-containing protein [Nostocaceae cyanobacterium]